MSKNYTCADHVDYSERLHELREIEESLPLYVMPKTVTRLQDVEVDDPDNDYAPMVQWIETVRSEFDYTDPLTCDECGMTFYPKRTCFFRLLPRVSHVG